MLSYFSTRFELTSASFTAGSCLFDHQRTVLCQRWTLLLLTVCFLILLRNTYLKDNPLSFSTLTIVLADNVTRIKPWNLVRISLIQSRLVHDMPINSRQMHVHEEQHHLSEIKLPVLISVHQLTCYKINTRHSSTHRISSHALTLWKAHCLTLIMFSYHSLYTFTFMHLADAFIHLQCNKATFIQSDLQCYG